MRESRAAFSYAGVITRRSDSSLAIRSVEWMRDNGGQSFVSQAEAFYYTLTAPATVSSSATASSEACSTRSPT